MEFVDIEKLEKQKKYLKNQVIYGNNKDYFLVNNMEPGLGKTLAIEEALAELYKLNPKIKTLYIKKFKDTENLIGSSHWNINSQAGKNIALAIDKDNFISNRKQIKKFPIIVITHEKYKALCKNKYQRKIFTEGRINLIVDEEIDMLETFHHNQETLLEFRNKLPKQIQPQYDICVQELMSQLVISANGKYFFNAKDKKTDEFKRLRTKARKYITKEYAGQFTIDTQRQMRVKDFIDEIEHIEQFLNKTCVMENSNIYTYDSRIKPFLLQNNIILDANAGFNYIYRLNPIFKLQRQAKIVDHSNWTLHVADVNSTRTKKEKALNFHKQVERFVHTRMNENSLGLVIGSKDDENIMTLPENVKQDHYGNLIGKNEWRDSDKVFSIHLPQYPFYVYILKYLYYTGKKLDNRSNWDAIRDVSTVRFRNKELEKLRISTIASEMYQGVKRINRNNEKKADIYILCHDKEIVKIIKRQLKNIQYKEFDLPIRYYRKKYDNDNRQKNSYSSKLIMLLSGLDNGKYPKSDIREQLKYKNKKHFGELFKNKDVEKYLKENPHIQIYSHYVLVS